MGQGKKMKIITKKTVLTRLDDIDTKIDYLTKITEELAMSVESRKAATGKRKAALSGYMDMVTGMIKAKGGDTAMFDQIKEMMEIDDEH